MRSFSLESTAYSPTIINTPSTVDETPGIIPTIFTTRHEPPEYHANVDERVCQLDQEKVLEQVTKSFTSNPGIFDAISPKSVMRALHNELRALVSAQVPLLTENSLQRIIEELLSTLDYTQKVAEVELQEISEDLKTELQIEKDKGIEDIDEHAQEILTDVKSQMEDLASGHMVAFEDLLQQTSEQLIQTLKGFLSVVAKAVAIGREQEHCSASPSADVVAKSPASIATKLFLNDFKELCTTDKVKVLERLASQNTAEVFLTVDQELRGAWVASWIA